MHAQLWQQGEYSAVSASLDREHHILDSHWSDIIDPSKDELSATEIKARIELISALLISHFSNEEELMRAISFEGIEDHRAEHQRIKDAFEELLASIPASAARWSWASKFLQQWTADHQVNHDRSLDDFIKRFMTSHGSTF